MAGSSKKVIIAALIGNGLIAITKFIAAGITHSSAMLSEGIHSLVDTGNQVLLLFGLKQASKPADEEHPFGHGREVYFWSFIVAILIFAIGAGISIYEGIQHLLHPAESSGNYMVNYVVLGLAMVFEGAAWYYAWREFRKHKGDKGYFKAVREGKDPTLFVVLFEDSAAMAGLIVAFFGVLLTDITGIHYFDGGASVLIGVILAITAAWLAYETKGLLIGESASREKIAGIKQIAINHTEVKHVNEALTMHMGPQDILVNLSVDFVDGITAERVEEVIATIDREIKEQFPAARRVYIEAAARQRQG